MKPLKYTALAIALLAVQSAPTFAAEGNLTVRATDNPLSAAQMESPEVKSSATAETVGESREIADDRVEEARGDAEARIQSLEDSNNSGMPATATTTIDMR